MGQARQKKLNRSKKFQRAFHLMKLISHYNDYQITKFLERRKY